MITITGCSDDLVEVNGDISEDFGAFEGTHLTLSDGTVLRADFGDNDGVWRFIVIRVGRATLAIRRLPDDEVDAEGGSQTDVVTVTSPIEWVKAGIHDVPGAGEIPETFADNVAVDENTTDGYHSFKELYEYRLLYNAALFNEWARMSVESRADYVDLDVHKSRRHSGGEPCFGGGWFVVVAQLPTGQISNHYPDEAWGLFKVPERDRAAEWDGHTPADVAARLRAFLTARGGQ